MQIFVVTYLFPHIVPLLPFRSVTTTAWSASPGLFDLVSNGQALEALIIFALFGLMAIHFIFVVLYKDMLFALHIYKYVILLTIILFREVMKEMKLMRELRHDNVNRNL